MCTALEDSFRKRKKAGLRLPPFTVVFNFAFWGEVKLYVGDSESFAAFSLELLGWPRTWP